MCLPTAVEPVNAIMSTSGWRTSASPASSPVPVTIPHHARRQHLEGRAPAAASASGVWSAGLMITVLPAASAGATFQAMSSSG
mgnify:CR=1 FL=1